MIPKKIFSIYVKQVWKFKKIFDKGNFLPYILHEFASSSNGRTADSDSVNLGSSPGEAAIIPKSPDFSGRFYVICAKVISAKIGVIYRDCSMRHVAPNHKLLG